jgi:hypothetical protein
MVRNPNDGMANIGGVLQAVRTRASSVKDKYMHDPVGLAHKLGLKLPEKPVAVMARLGVYDPEKHGPITPGLRDLVEDVCLGTVDSAVAVANRGGGKSQGVSFIEFFLVFIKDFDALNLGGSELQADQVYQYILSYIESDKQFQDMVEGEPIAARTSTKAKAWIRVLTASPKSVRSPHAGGRKRDGRLAGGLLVIDEEAEADPKIVAAALPTINTAVPSVNVRASTFHNAEGSFAEVIDNAEEMGYKTYKWDIFDVAQKCDCVDGCQSEEQCFREDHWEDYTDPVSGEQTRRLLHRAYCGGRAMYADGWIPITEIVKLWRRGKRNHATWEVEAMGSRPSSKGYVIRDLTQFATNVTEENGYEVYLPGSPVTITVDWGARAAGVEVWQEQPGDTHALIEAEQVEEAGVTVIIGVILGLVEKYKAEFVEVAADIGGGGNYLNPKLRDEHRIPVRDVNFAEQKEAAVAALNVFSEGGSMIIPAEFDIFTHQARNWKRVNGRIQKGNDHMMDSAICYFAKFIDRLGLNHIRVPPRAIRSGAGSKEYPGSFIATPRVAAGRVAVIRSLGGSRR